MALSDSEIAFFDALLRDRAGLELTRWLVEARVEARLACASTTIERYISLLKTPEGAAELGALIEAVRVGETRFFRHQSHVDAVRDVVVPAWKLRGVTRPKVWSAGCASGEEAYTLALVLAAALPSPGWQADILATDVSPTAIAIASAGRYARAALAHVPPAHHHAFDVLDDAIEVRAAFRSTITFLEENLATADRSRRLDLVWCRNVLIYFDPEVRARVLRKLVSALAPGGFLFLGYSESLRDVPGLRAVPWQGQVLWEKAIEGDARRSSTSELGRPSAPIASTPEPASSSAPGPGTQRARAGAPERPRAMTGATTFRVSVTTGGALESPLDAAMRAPGLSELTIDLDAASFLEDDVAPVLRRARAKASAAGVRLRLRATRPGTQRWLRRHGLAEEP